MNFPFYIARRYLFSKKSTHAINLISAVSVVGVATATMALVVTLSVFNGFHDLVASFFTSFDPQIKVMPVKGKTAPADDPVLVAIKKLPEVDVAMESVEDQALAIYRDRQSMVVIKGVEDSFSQLTHFGEILYPDAGKEVDLHAGNLEYGVPGIRLAQMLGIGAYWPGYLHVPSWPTPCCRWVRCSMSASRNTTATTSSLRLPSPATSSDSKAWCRRWNCG